MCNDARRHDCGGDTSSDNRARMREAQKNRVIMACSLCRSRKVRCDGELPCSPCQRHHRADECVYQKVPQAETDALRKRKHHRRQLRRSEEMHRHAPEHEASRLRASSLGSMYSRPPNSANRSARVSHSPEEHFQASLTPSMLMTSPLSSTVDRTGGQDTLASAQEHYGGLYSDVTTGILMAPAFATEGGLDPSMRAETSMAATQPFPMFDPAVPPTSSPGLLLSLASTSAPMMAHEGEASTSEPSFPLSQQDTSDEGARAELQEVLDFIQQYGR